MVGIKGKQGTRCAYRVGFPLGARPKHMSVPRDLMETTITEGSSYNDRVGDPRPEQAAILKQCLLTNTRQLNRNSVDVVRVSTPTNQSLGNDNTQTESYAVRDPSQEQKEVIRALAESNRSKNIRKLQINSTMDNIAESLESMNLRELRHFQQDLSEQRKSRRLQGNDPEQLEAVLKMEGY